MHLKFKITEGELVELIGSLTPIKIALDDTGKGGHSETTPVESDKWVRLHTPSNIQLIRGEGIEFRFKMDVHWPVPVLPDDYSLETVKGSLRPKIVQVDGSTSLLLALSIAELNVEHLPKFLDKLLLGQVRKKLTELEAELIWKMTDVMSVSAALPSWAAPRTIAHISSDNANIEISPAAVRVALPLHLGVATKEGAKANTSFERSEVLEAKVSVVD